LGDGRTVSLGAYVKAWKAALAAPAGSTFDKGFNWYPETREETLRTFRKGLADRINRRIDGFPGALRPEVFRGRKWSYEWQVETSRAAQQLNSRVVIHWLPIWLKARFAHRIEDRMAA
jgi:hypothetical protein